MRETLDCAFYVVRSAPARSNLSMPPSDTRRLGDDAATAQPRASRRGCACCGVSPPHPTRGVTGQVGGD